MHLGRAIRSLLAESGRFLAGQELEQSPKADITVVTAGEHHAGLNWKKRECWRVAGGRERGWHIVDAQTNMSKIRQITDKSRVACGGGSSWPKLLMPNREFLTLWLVNRNPHRFKKSTTTWWRWFQKDQSVNLFVKQGKISNWELHKKDTLV